MNAEKLLDECLHQLSVKDALNVLCLFEPIEKTVKSDVRDFVSREIRMRDIRGLDKPLTESNMLSLINLPQNLKNWLQVTQFMENVEQDVLKYKENFFPTMESLPIREFLYDRFHEQIEHDPNFMDSSTKTDVQELCIPDFQPYRINGCVIDYGTRCGLLRGVDGKKTDIWKVLAAICQSANPKADYPLYYDFVCGKTLVFHNSVTILFPVDDSFINANPLNLVKRFFSLFVRTENHFWGDIPVENKVYSDSLRIDNVERVGEKLKIRCSFNCEFRNRWKTVLNRDVTAYYAKKRSIVKSFDYINQFMRDVFEHPGQIEIEGHLELERRVFLKNDFFAKMPQKTKQFYEREWTYYDVGLLYLKYSAHPQKDCLDALKHVKFLRQRHEVIYKNIDVDYMSYSMRSFDMDRLKNYAKVYQSMKKILLGLYPVFEGFNQWKASNQEGRGKFMNYLGQLIQKNVSLDPILFLDNEFPEGIRNYANALVTGE